ncbi:MAG TPA: hypothetical protein VKD72_05195, partial [Gemmataceae bacterium]|nr:hypothetical protein [Gemmataceae bacterium]
ESWEPVPVPLADNPNEHAVLVALYIKDGQRVERGAVLARFTNIEDERKIATLQQQISGLRDKLALLQPERLKAEDKIKEVEQEVGERLADLKEVTDRLKEHGEVTAPRSGIVMSPPSIDDVNKRWDKKQPLCKIGTPDNPPRGGRKLRVLIPVTPSEYNLLQQDMRGPGRSDSPLLVSVRVRGMGRDTWRGVLTTLPQSEAATIPPLLSNRTGGPVAVKPGTQPEKLEPQTQQYLVVIELVEPDVDMHPGVRAKVKIHCRKRPLSWWAWRSINDLFNLGLM